MEGKEIKLLVEKKLLERSAEVVEIKMRVEALAKDIQADLKAAGQEVKSVQAICEILVDMADEATSTGLAEPFDAPIAKKIVAKLLKLPVGVKLEEWFQAVRSKVI